MEVNVKEAPDTDGVFIITCGQWLEWDARSDFVALIDEAANDETQMRGVVLDLGGVDFINSAGIGAIFALRKHLKQHGGSIVVARPKPVIRRLLDTINLPALIPVAPDMDEALLALESEGAR
jgi:anti-anti-sigma factor